VVISDPHIKVDPDYTVYAQAKEQGFFVKNPEGGDFEGVCWPGMVSFISTSSVSTNETFMADIFILNGHLFLFQPHL
jgi:alpha-glucosidase (family GH31 glycosyl hydrolase)